MKLSSAILIGIEASHFRAVNYDVIQAGPGQLQVSRTMAWRWGSDSYSGGCTSAHIANQTPSGIVGTEKCALQSGGSCGSVSASYIATYIEDQLTSSNNYCYGYEADPFPKPSGPFSMSWTNCCWVPFTTDNGTSKSGGSYGFRATVNDIDNNSPQVKMPPVWKIMAGCPGQTLSLNPVDLDNDLIKCRWATSAEGLGATHSMSDFASLSLDEDTCVITYDGTMDATTVGVKPIAVQVEDYDADGNVRSSIPVQFLATVWTPSLSQGKRSGAIFQMPDVFPDEDDHDDSGRRRRDGNLPAYCAAAPTLVAPSPAAGSVIAVKDSVTVNVKAESGSGRITRFVFSSPMGMTCTAVNGVGESTCQFTPTAAQQNQAFNFCFLAEDGAGMVSERRCVTLAVGVEVDSMTEEEPCSDKAASEFVTGAATLNCKTKEAYLPDRQIKKCKVTCDSGKDHVGPRKIKCRNWAVPKTNKHKTKQGIWETHNGKKITCK